MHLGKTMMILSVAAMAQTKIDLSTQGKNVDFSGAGITKPAKTGPDLPAQCGVGELFFKTTAPEGANLFACTAANRWSVQAGNGSGGAIGLDADGVLVGSRPEINLIAGPGIASAVADTGYRFNVQTAVDTAFVETQAGTQSGKALLCASAGRNAAAYTCALDPTLGGYAAGMVLHWKPDMNGAGGPTTLNVDTLGPVRVKMPDGISDPAAGDIVGGALYFVWHDGTVFRLLTARTGGQGITGTTIPAAGAIPQADGTGKLAQGWIDFTGYQTTSGAFPWEQLTGVPGSFPASPHAGSHGSNGSDPLSASSIGAAPLASPALTGTPTAPTAQAGDNSARIATTAYVDGGLSGRMPLSAAVNAQTGSAYTLQAGDNGKLITFTNASGVALTIPSGLGAGFNCLIVQLGAGAVTPVASGVTLVNRQNFTKTAGQYAFASLVAYAADTFLIGGDLQ